MQGLPTAGGTWVKKGNEGKVEQGTVNGAGSEEGGAGDPMISECSAVLRGGSCPADACTRTRVRFSFSLFLPEKGTKPSQPIR